MIRVEDQELIFTLKDAGSMGHFISLFSKGFAHSMMLNEEALMQMEIYEPTAVIPGSYLRIKLQKETDGTWSLKFNKKAYLKDE